MLAYPVDGLPLLALRRLNLLLGCRDFARPVPHQPRGKSPAAKTR